MICHALYMHGQRLLTSPFSRVIYPDQSAGLVFIRAAEEARGLLRKALEKACSSHNDVLCFYNYFTLH